MAKVTDIITLVRNLLGDYEHVDGRDVFVYENSAVFTITESNVIEVSSVLKNDVELTSGQFSFNSSTNKVTVTASLTSGDTIEIQYSYYPNYSDSEIESYLRAALVHLSVNNFYNFTIGDDLSTVEEDDTIWPDPTDTEKNLIAMVTSLLIEPDNKSYALPDLRINVPNDLPLHFKIGKVIAICKKNSHGIFNLS
jgi:hypothetical protein